MEAPFQARPSSARKGRSSFGEGRNPFKVITQRLPKVTRVCLRSSQAKMPPHEGRPSPSNGNSTSASSRSTVRFKLSLPKQTQLQDIIPAVLLSLENVERVNKKVSGLDTGLRTQKSTQVQFFKQTFKTF